MHGALRRGPGSDDHPCPPSLDLRGACGKPYKKMLRRPPCVEEGIGGPAQDDLWARGGGRAEAADGATGSRVTLAPRTIRAIRRRTSLIAMRGFLAQKVYAGARTSTIRAPDTCRTCIGPSLRIPPPGRGWVWPCSTSRGTLARTHSRRPSKPSCAWARTAASSCVY